jgi:hypothetical protein
MALDQKRQRGLTRDVRIGREARPANYSLIARRHSHLAVVKGAR